MRAPQSRGRRKRGSARPRAAAPGRGAFVAALHRSLLAYLFIDARTALHPEEPEVALEN